MTIYDPCVDSDGSRKVKSRDDATLLSPCIASSGERVFKLASGVYARPYVDSDGKRLWRGPFYLSYAGPDPIYTYSHDEDADTEFWEISCVTAAYGTTPVLATCTTLATIASSKITSSESDLYPSYLIRHRSTDAIEYRYVITIVSGANVIFSINDVSLSPVWSEVSETFVRCGKDWLAFDKSQSSQVYTSSYTRRISDCSIVGSTSPVFNGNVYLYRG